MVQNRIRVRRNLKLLHDIFLAESRRGVGAYLAQDWFPKYSMTMIPVRIVQSSSQSSLSARPGLQAGNVVNARVLYDMGGGQYAISLAGQKIAVRSQAALEPGSVFAAKIIVKGAGRGAVAGDAVYFGAGSGAFFAATGGIACVSGASS